MSVFRQSCGGQAALYHVNLLGEHAAGQSRHDSFELMSLLSATI